jgi:hypothetical protein
MFKTFIITVSLLLLAGFAVAQNNKPYVRIAKIVVDSAQLEFYKSALKTGMETAVKLERGVLSMPSTIINFRPTSPSLRPMPAKKPTSLTFKLLTLRNINPARCQW